MLIRADARKLPLADGCVHCCVTSPPYWGLRRYPDARQIGLEPTPQTYVQSLVQVFREVWRVLRDDGTVWINLGDSYAAGGYGGGGSFMDMRGGDGSAATGAWAHRKEAKGWRAAPEGLKQKDLVGIPWRVAFALQADGWYLRSDIIWAKPNPMPESVTDRPTKSHEYLFLLAKAERYYYDAKAIAEPVSAAMLAEMEQRYDGLGLKDYDAAGVQNPSSVKARIIRKARYKAANLPGQSRHGYTLREEGNSCGGNGITRNRRSVWSVPTLPYAGAHFATMPEALVEPCILAGCPLGGLVLDPFCGTFTVGAVAARLGRRAVGVDLSYQDLAKERTAQRGLAFAQESA